MFSYPFPLSRWPAWLAHAFAIVGIVILTWLAFGRGFQERGHRGDTWSYMHLFEQEGAYSILQKQPGRLALPWAWALGFALAGSQGWIYHLLIYLFLALAAICLYFSLILFLPHYPTFPLKA